jgi:hypothetical protein
MNNLSTQITSKTMLTIIKYVGIMTIIIIGILLIIESFKFNGLFQL